MKPNPLPAALMALALTPLTAQAVQLPVTADTYLAATSQGAADSINSTTAASQNLGGKKATQASQPVAIGGIGPAGGKVFYLSDETGLHGLEAAPIDQTAGIQWGCITTVVGGTSPAVGTGKANTAAINAKCRAGTAAQVAASYSLNGFTDWYLPSSDELNLMYQHKAAVGSFASNYYWSSSEIGSNAWLQSFGSGSRYSSNKRSTLAVRVIRAF